MAIALEFRHDVQIIETARRERADIRSDDELRFHQFWLPVRFRIGEVELFRRAGGSADAPGWLRCPVIDLAIEIPLSLDEAWELGSSSSDPAERGSGSMRWRRFGAEIEVSVRFTGQTARAPYHELKAASRLFADAVRAYLTTAIPRLLDHPHAGAWFRGESDDYCDEDLRHYRWIPRLRPLARPGRPHLGPPKPASGPPHDWSRSPVLLDFVTDPQSLAEDRTPGPLEEGERAVLFEYFEMPTRFAIRGVDFLMCDGAAHVGVTSTDLESGTLLPEGHQPCPRVHVALIDFAWGGLHTLHRAADSRNSYGGRFPTSPTERSFNVTGGGLITFDLAPERDDEIVVRSSITGASTTIDLLTLESAWRDFRARVRAFLLREFPGLAHHPHFELFRSETDLLS